MIVAGDMSRPSLVNMVLDNLLALTLPVVGMYPSIRLNILVISSVLLSNETTSVNAGLGQ